MPRVIVTTSWDDAAASGIRVAALLAEHAVQGTFYVPTGELGKEGQFTGCDLRQLANEGFEIGGHTISHRILTELSSNEVAVEVTESKKALENILGRAVTTFCYPKGRFNRRVIQQVEDAGYLGARTTEMLSSNLSFSRFEMPTTIQAFPHRRSNYLRNLVRLGKLSRIAKSMADLASFESWLQLGKVLFDRTLREGGVWHLYGHPWEIESLNLWSQLDELLAYVSGRREVAYACNRDVLGVNAATPAIARELEVSI